MSHYIANLRDIEFCLFDLLGRDKVMGSAPYGEVDRDTAMGMLEEMKRLCENDLAASFVEGDRIGTDFNKATGDVKLPLAGLLLNPSPNQWFSLPVLMFG